MYYKLYNMRYKLSNMCYKLCNKKLSNMIVKNIGLQRKNYRQAVKINLFPISDSFLVHFCFVTVF